MIDKLTDFILITLKKIDFKSNKWIVSFLLKTTISILVVFLIIFITTGLAGGVFLREMCFSNKCLEFFFKEFSFAFSFITSLGTIMAGGIALSGFLVALKSYLGAKKTSELSNHISHLSLFNSFISVEVEKRDRLSKSSFDHFKWYNLIYPNSRDGFFSVSVEYVDFINKTNSIINESNDLSTGIAAGGYYYKPHQEKIKKIFLLIGVELHSQPRLDFLEMEEQLYDLVNVVNMSFCISEHSMSISPIKYK
ncbi:retron Ec48 family effector membrane protein [Serratia sp. FDAARGOS_506]|uniref:retron Ec48 family effector membrane protein n=1 Tax=Serratia sp. FDAARGOS_506 TaxID=2420306 RepID=UPI000F4D8EDE|nr:retron Ec48 family effector membrane protein [Serratia sp. FDAARGOS_506]